MVTFYHYTKPDSAKAIFRSGVIRKSTQRARGRDDARYGSGVYLTTLPPTTAKDEIAFNNYDGLTPAVVERMIDSGKFCSNDFPVFKWNLCAVHPLT